MSRTSIEAAIRSRVESFAGELQGLLIRAAVQAVESALSGRSVVVTRKLDAHATRELVPEPAPYEMTPARPSSPRQRVTRQPRKSAVTAAEPAVSLENYERMAIQRALAESGGNRTAAAKMLQVGRTTLSRRIRVLGMRSADDPPAPNFVADLPLSLEAYEKAALLRALDENGGRVVRAGKQLGLSKSAVYRLMGKHGFHGAPKPRAS